MTKSSRCYNKNCNKKLGLFSFDCRCRGKFCSKCRYSTVHNCSYDYKNETKKVLRKNLVKVVPLKVNKIS